MKEATARPWTGVEGMPRRAQDPARPTLPPTPSAGQTRSPKLPTCSGPFPPPHSEPGRGPAEFSKSVTLKMPELSFFPLQSLRSGRRERQPPDLGNGIPSLWVLGGRGVSPRQQAQHPPPPPQGRRPSRPLTPRPRYRAAAVSRVPGGAAAQHTCPLGAPRTEMLLVPSGPGTPQGGSCTAGYPESHRPPGLVAPGWAGEGAQTAHLGAGQGCGKGTFAEAEGTGSSSRVGGPCRGLSRDGRRQGLDDRATQLWDDSRGRGRREQEEPQHGQNAWSCHPPNVPAVK